MEETPKRPASFDEMLEGDLQENQAEEDELPRNDPPLNIHIEPPYGLDTIVTSGSGEIPREVHSPGTPLHSNVARRSHGDVEFGQRRIFLEPTPEEGASSVASTGTWDDQIPLTFRTFGGDDSLVHHDDQSHGTFDSIQEDRRVSFGGVTATERQIVESLQLLSRDAYLSSDDRSTNGSLASVASDSSFLGGPNDRGNLMRSNSKPSFRFTPNNTNKRVSLIADLETGREGVRGHVAFTRDKSECRAQPRGARRRRGFRNFRRKLNPFGGGIDEKGPDMSVMDSESDDDDDNDDDFSKDSRTSVNGRFMVSQFHVPAEDSSSGMIHVEADVEVPRKQRQYRLQAIEAGRNPFLRTVQKLGVEYDLNVGIYEDSLNQGKSCNIFGFHPNRLVTRHLHWAFRSSFPAVILSACASFFAITMGFAILVMLIGFNKPECVHVNGQKFGENHEAYFLDAFALSWTTFSTVGYGLVYPGVSSVTPDVKSCTGITMLCTLESFVGILFSSLWGAIFFAKVSRVASVARVEFSDPIVIRYGTGVLNIEESSSEEEDEHESRATSDSGSNLLSGDGDDGDEEDPNFRPSKIPCPLLEFRVLNSRAGQYGGEIIDASMNLVASIDESQASIALKNAVRGTRRKGKKGKRRGARRTGMGKGRSRDSGLIVTRESVAKAQETLRSLLTSGRLHQEIVEDPTGKLIPKKIFAKLEIESQEHPFFKRVWIARHVLDQYSPLLKQEAKELIRLNGGHWPLELNNAEAVRASVHFDQIVVSLSGTSNADANSVYAQKVYDYVDLCVGYRFCDLLFREKDGSVGVDRTLLNDVKEQRGGGGDDLGLRARRAQRDIVIL